ncbi:MAG: restriction endonuclease subunit S [Deltaproteobacteria bacterium]|nr:restriction endonuclease subunit S [Deltaproteobacteria bacterium]
MTKSSLNKLPLKSLFRLDTTSCLPASQPEQAFLHHSIPAWDESGGPVVELGNTIGSNKFLISHACVLVSKLNPRKSRVSVVRDLHGEFPRCASTEFMVYVPIHEDADIGFYSWYMKSECFQSELEKVATGTTNSHVRVTPKETLNWKIAHPPLPEQRRIAEILDTIDEVIQKTEALISKLKAMKQGLLHDLLTRGLDKNGKLRDPKAHPEQFKDSPLGRIPKEWGINPLEKLAEVDRGKFTHRPRNDPRFYGGAYPFVQTGDIAKAEGDILKKYSQTLNNSGSAVSREFPKNTIAITIAANIADTAILGQPMYFPDSIVGAIVRPPNNVRYIELCIRRAKQILNAHAPQSAQKNINLEDLRPLLIPTSTSEEQNRIGDMYDAYSNRVQSEEQYREKLKLQKKGLMHDLLTGKVRVKV